MKRPFSGKFTVGVWLATLAGSAYVIAAPQVAVPRIPQAQVPRIDVPTIGGSPSRFRPQVPAAVPDYGLKMPVMSAELMNAMTEAAEKGLDFLPGRVLVKFRDTAGVEGQARALSAIGKGDAQPGDIEWTGDVAIVKDSSGVDPRELARRLNAQPEVEYAEPDYLLKLHATPNDPSYAARQWNLQQLNFPRAWDLVPGGSASVIVAVVDTGVTAVATQNITVQTWSGSAIVSYAMPVGASPDFTLSRFVMPRDFIVSTTNPGTVVVDTDGHGSHVAGTVGQDTNNNLSLAGIAYNVRIMPLKACITYWDLQFARSAAGITGFAPIGTGTGCPTSATNAAIRFAADNGARALNYSIGGNNPNTTIRDAMAYAVSRGVFVAMSNGNDFEDGNPTTYPASYGPTISGAMAVASTNRIDGRSYYSSTGSWTEIAAPGGDSRQGNTIWQSSVTSANYNPATVIFPRFDQYSERGFQGTSMASPHVAGLAALIVSQMPGITPAQIEYVIRTTARDIGAAGRDDSFGYGLIQPRAALFGQAIR